MSESNNCMVAASPFCSSSPFKKGADASRCTNSEGQAYYLETQDSTTVYLPLKGPKPARLDLNSRFGLASFNRRIFSSIDAMQRFYSGTSDHLWGYVKTSVALKSDECMCLTDEGHIFYREALDVRFMVPTELPAEIVPSVLSYGA